MEYHRNSKKVENILKKSFFIAQSSGIYGGIAGLYDYGPLGCSLKNAINSTWRKDFVEEESLFELDTSVILPFEVLKASGHLEKFSDILVFDKETGEFYRADHQIKKNLENRKQTSEIKEALERLNSLTIEECISMISKFKIKSDWGNDLVDAVNFNLIFQTSVGPKSQNVSFLRPETAQGQFLNFKKLYNLNYEKLPFGSATIGRVFRNEISPRSGLLRVREFDQAEIEYFIDPLEKEHPKFEKVSHLILNFKLENLDNYSDKLSLHKTGNEDYNLRITIKTALKEKLIDNEILGYFIGKTFLFLKKVGIKEEYLRFRQHQKDEMAHYANDCWDAEILTSYGWIECVGIADRSCYDLQMHQNHSKNNLSAMRTLVNPVIAEKYEIVLDKKALGKELKGELPAFIQAAEKILLEKNKALTEETLLLHDAKDSYHFTKKDGEFFLCFEFKQKNYELNLIKKQEKIFKEYFIPNVIEPSFGIGRILYCLCEHVYWERDKERSVLSFNPRVAPIQCEISFLVRDEKLSAIVDEVYCSLKKFRSLKNERNVTIGRKYSKADEIGVPYYLTVDFDSLIDNKITIRERDTMQQIRVCRNDACRFLSDLIENNINWKDLKV